MPATPTTPTVITADSVYTPTTTGDPSTTTVRAPVLSGAAKLTTVTGVTRYVMPNPIRRWNGSSWTYLYKPRT